MQNNEIKIIYNKILDIIKNTNDYCEFYIRDKKFIFRDRTTPNIISIILTDKELLDLDSGIYSERTRLLKELEYMNRIKENEEIEPFKNMKERDIFITSLKRLKKVEIKTYITNYLQDIWKSLFFYSKMEENHQNNYEMTQFIFGLFGFAAIFYLLTSKNFPLVLPSILAATTPTVFLITKDYLKERFKRIRKHNERKFIIDSYKVNIDCLSEKMIDKQDYLIEERTQKYFPDKTQDKIEPIKEEQILSEPVYNEIYKLLNILSSSNLENDVTTIILNKIKEIKEEYVIRINEIDKQTYSLENRYTIQNEVIKKLSIIEYELQNEIEKNNDTTKTQKELDIINQKILSLEKFKNN